MCKIFMQCLTRNITCELLDVSFIKFARVISGSGSGSVISRILSFSQAKWCKQFSLEKSHQILSRTKIKQKL